MHAGAGGTHEWPSDLVQKSREGVSAPSGSNGLGIAGFVVSLVGLVTCGCLSPIGVVLSLVAVFRQPRRMAMAGLVIGLAGCVLAAILCVLYVSAIIGLQPAIQDGAAVAKEIHTFRESHGGSLPSSLDEMPALNVQAKIDEWGNLYHFKAFPDSGKIELTSDGEDSIAGTSDDVRIRIEGTRVFAYRGKLPRLLGGG